MIGNPKDPKRNGDGYIDMTAYDGMRNIESDKDRYEAKKYLRRFLDAEAELKRVEAEIEAMEQEIDSINVKLDGMPRGSDISDRTGNLATKLAEYHLDAINQRTKAWEKRKEVVNLINSLSRDHATLLYLRFVKDWTFEKIAVEMGYSWRQTMRIYADSLYEAIRKIRRL